MSGLSNLKAVHLQNPKNINLSYININSIRNKFGSFCSLISSHVNILSIAETKLDYSFPNAQFLIPNFHQPFRLDINRNSGGLLVFVRSSIPARMLSHYRLPPDIPILIYLFQSQKSCKTLKHIYTYTLTHRHTQTHAYACICVYTVYVYARVHICIIVYISIAITRENRTCKRLRVLSSSPENILR